MSHKSPSEHLWRAFGVSALFLSSSRGELRKNTNLAPAEVSLRSNKKVWLKCKNDHKW
ncbi:MAG: hypothetical protein IKX10_08315 [Lachnospiraceae bacterium]|nr:hypothetical protein [Lachnospiraceae bacterium]